MLKLICALSDLGINPWIAKVRIQLVNTKLESKVTHKKNSYFLEILTNLDKMFIFKFRDSFKIFIDF